MDPPAVLDHHHVYAWYGLTQANYVEHYGLLRQKMPNGRYEACKPRHSWNTNHIFFQLADFPSAAPFGSPCNALRPYQTLRDFEELRAYRAVIQARLALRLFRRNGSR